MNYKNARYYFVNGTKWARRAFWRIYHKPIPLFLKIAAGVWLGIHLTERF